MTALVDCPSCRAQTPTDGAHCDQCGIRFAECPKCGAIGTTPHCTADGVPMVPRTLERASAPGQAGGQAAPLLARQPSASVAVPEVPVVAPRVAPLRRNPGAQLATRRETPDAAAISPACLRLVVVSGHALPPLRIEPGDTIGREVGQHAATLAPVSGSGISRKHCRFDRGPTGQWTATDLGSSGGTDIRSTSEWPAAERAVPAHQPQSIAPGSFLRVGDVRFRVEGM